MNIVSTSPEIITPTSGDGVLKGTISYGVIGSLKSKLSDLDDVNFTDLEKNDMIQYNSNTGKWENVDFPMTMQVTEDNTLDISLFSF